jgi:hypothetical protein
VVRGDTRGGTRPVDGSEHLECELLDALAPAQGAERCEVRPDPNTTVAGMTPTEVHGLKSFLFCRFRLFKLVLEPTVHKETLRGSSQPPDFNLA